MASDTDFPFTVRNMKFPFEINLSLKKKILHQDKKKNSVPNC